MIQTLYKKSIIFIALLSSIYNPFLLCNHETRPTRFPVNCSLKPYNVNVLLVTDNGDNPTNPSTLRGALAIAEPGDVINFALFGGSEEIFLNEIYGPLVVAVPLIIDGSNTAGSGMQVTINGQNEINIGFLVKSSAPMTTIQNITITNLSGNETDPGTGTEPQTLPAYGIFIESNAFNCFIDNCTIENVLSGDREVAAGIYSEETTCPIVNNTITNIQSSSMVGSAPVANTGDVFGIYVEGDVQGQCSNNTLSQLKSGDATNNSGNVTGIDVGERTIQGDCIHNTLQNLQSGVASTVGSGDIRGVRVGAVIGDFSCNTMTQFSSSGGLSIQLSGFIIACDIGTITGNCSYNLCTDFTTADGDGSGSIRVFFVRFSIGGDFSHNTITAMTTGFAESPGPLRPSGDIAGLTTEGIGGVTSYNSLTSFSTGEGRWVSGSINGLMSKIFGSDVVHNTLTLFTTGNAQFVGDIQGIFWTDEDSEIGGNVAYNTLSQFTTGVATSNDPLGVLFISGFIKGISIGIVGGRVHDNLLEQFATGDTIPTVVGSSSTTGSIDGVEILVYLRGDMVNNTVQSMTVSDVADTVGHFQGIFVETINTDRLVACNTVDTAQGNSPTGSETGNSSFGIAIHQGDRITICHNTITNLTGLAGAPIYGLLLGNDPQNQSVTNSTIGDNLISNIMGGNQNGFGIVIVDENSLGNKLFNNSIFDINGKAIVIRDPLADTTDKTVTLNSVQCTNSGKLIINGSFNPDPSFINQPFLLQFFASNNNMPPEAEQLIGEQTILAQGNPTPFIIEFRPCPPTEDGQYITATATALVNPNNNTTELSNALETCSSINPLCAVILNPCPPPPPPNVCPINLTDAPPVPAPCPPVIVPPCPGTEVGTGSGH